MNSTTFPYEPDTPPPSGDSGDPFVQYVDRISAGAVQEVHKWVSALMDKIDTNTGSFTPPTPKPGLPDNVVPMNGPLSDSSQLNDVTVHIGSSAGTGQTVHLQEDSNGNLFQNGNKVGHVDSNGNVVINDRNTMFQVFGKHIEAPNTPNADGTITFTQSSVSK
jgi:hypothetical protein